MGVSEGAVLSGVVSIGPDLTTHPGIRKVAYYLNGAQSGKYYTAPFIWNGVSGFDTRTLANGAYSFAMVYTDGTGDHTVVINVTVNNLANNLPVITAIPNITVNEDAGTGPLSFTVSDAETPAGNLTVTGTSSSLALISNTNIVFGGTVSNRTVTITPLTNQSGTATITVNVFDGAATAVRTFVVTVNPVNDVPTLTAIPAVTINQGTNTGAIAFTVGDVETPAGNLTVTGTSSNTTLVPNANIVFSGTGTNRTMTITPANQSGTATITVNVFDGAATTTRTFVLTVNPVLNSAPTMTVLPNLTINQGTNTGVIAFTIGDAETPAGNLTLSGLSSNSNLVLNANIVFGGTLSSRTVTITPLTNQSGTATITVNVFDGTVTTTRSFVLTVNPSIGNPDFVGITEGAVLNGVVNVGPNLTAHPGIRKVAYYLNGAQSGKYYAAPFTWGGVSGFDTQTLANGTYALAMVYTDGTGDHTVIVNFTINRSEQRAHFDIFNAGAAAVATDVTFRIFRADEKSAVLLWNRLWEPAAQAAVSEQEMVIIARETGFSRKQIAALAKSLIPGKTEKSAHSAIFIPLPAELTIPEQERLIEAAILNMKQFRDKAVIFVTSAHLSERLLNQVKSDGEGRMVVVTLGAEQNSFQFVEDFFNSNLTRKISGQVRRLIYDAGLKASRNTFGSKKMLARGLEQKSLVLAPEQIFGTEKGSVGLVAQQFLFRAGKGNLERVYDAHIQYAFKIAGLRIHEEVDIDVQNNIQWHNLSLHPGSTRITFTEEGLEQVVRFLNALIYARQVIAQSA